MAAGGKRLGAGRRKGTTNAKLYSVRAAVIQAGRNAAVQGITPLEYMLKVMRTSNDQKRRDIMAIAAAAYVHPRLTSVDAKVEINQHEDNVRALHSLIVTDHHDTTH